MVLNRPGIERPSSQRRPRRDRVSVHEVAVGLAALDHLAAIRIERVVDDPLRRIVLMVVLEAEMPETFGDGFDSRSLRLMVQSVVGVGAVDDPPEQYQRRIAGQTELFQDRLERAFVAVPAALDVPTVLG